jgi:hypothetical protein
MYLPFTATVGLAGGRALIMPEYVLYNIVTNCPFYGQANSHTFSHDLFSPTVSSIVKEYKDWIKCPERYNCFAGRDGYKDFLKIQPLQAINTIHETNPTLFFMMFTSCSFILSLSSFYHR